MNDTTEKSVHEYLNGLNPNQIRRIDGIRSLAKYIESYIPNDHQDFSPIEFGILLGLSINSIAETGW